MSWLSRARCLAVAAALAACSPSPPQLATTSPVQVSALRPVQPQALASAPSPPSTLARCPEEAATPKADKSDPQLTRTVPAQNIGFGAVVCKAGRELWRDDAGRIRVCTVAKRVTTGGIDIGPNAYSHFYADGRPFQTSLARPQRLRTAAGATIPCGADHVVLSETGSLEHCKLDKPTTVSGIACRAGESISFFSTGQLRGATMDRPFQALSATFPAGTSLHFHPDGSLAGGWLGKPLRVGKYALRLEFKVHPQGSLSQFDLAEPQTISGHRFVEFSSIGLRPDGTLRSARFVSDRGSMPHGELWTDTTYQRFDCHEKLSSSRVEHYQAPSR